MTLKSSFEKHLPTLFSVAQSLANGRFEIFPPRRTFALGSLHGEIKRRFSKGPGIYFEVGANNGLAYSNTAYLEKYCGWTGVLVEAVPHKYVECVRNRPRSQVFHAALVPKEFSERYIEISYSNLMSSTKLSTLDNVDAHTAKGGEFLGIERPLLQENFLAPARTVDSILKEIGYPKIKFFSLDVEGAELSVLQGIDFSITKPECFLIEAEDLNPIDEFMSSKGYSFAGQVSYHDYLFVRDDE